MLTVLYPINRHGKFHVAWAVNRNNANMRYNFILAVIIKFLVIVCAAETTPVDELEVNISFHQWLASVTERINQTMHYQFDGE